MTFTKPFMAYLGTIKRDDEQLRFQDLITLTELKMYLTRRETKERLLIALRKFFWKKVRWRSYWKFWVNMLFLNDIIDMIR